MLVITIDVWILHGYCMDTAWILHGYCMDTAWILHGIVIMDE